MLDKVLYLVHCETYEPELVRCLTRLHAVGCRELLLVHVPKTEEVLQHVPSLLKDALRHCLAEITRQQLVALAEPCQAQGITARSILTEGAFAWIEVQQLVQREAVALVVVGPYIGSHVEATVGMLMASTRVPLLVVKVPARVAQAPEEVLRQSLCGRVLYPTDWSPCARQAQDYLLHLTPLGLSEVIVAHVVAPTAVAQLSAAQRAAHRAQVEQQLAQTQGALVEAGLAVRPVVLEGDPAHELVHLAAREDVALLVMGTTGTGRTAEPTLGSVSGAVAQMTERSILLVCPT
jgi:nucleotide-binding universal stress UspA family protein